MRALVNLAVDLDERFARDDATAVAAPTVTFADGVADERTLAWIDLEFGGWWSSEVAASRAVVARDASGAPIGFAAYAPQGLDYVWLRGLAREADVGIFGPFGVAPAARGGWLGPALLNAALVRLRTRGYARALIPAVGDAKLVRYYEAHVGARIAERVVAGTISTARLRRSAQCDTAVGSAQGDTLIVKPRVVVLASGSGTNFQSVIDAARHGTLPIDVVALVTNDARAYALERARVAGIPARVVAWRRRAEARGDGASAAEARGDGAPAAETRDEYDARLLAAVRAETPDLVLLLGWMHLLAPSFIEAFPSLLNVHPAYLPLDPSRDDVCLPDGTRMPAFRGAHALRDALNSGPRWVGASVHAVTAATDRGRIYARRPMAVAANEGEGGHGAASSRPAKGADEEQVLARLHAIEHDIVAAAVRRWLYERE